MCCFAFVRATCVNCSEQQQEGIYIYIANLNPPIKLTIHPRMRSATHIKILQQNTRMRFKAYNIGWLLYSDVRWMSNYWPLFGICGISTSSICIVEDSLLNCGHIKLILIYEFV